MYVIIMLDQV